jgi:hypothetical protein
MSLTISDILITKAYAQALNGTDISQIADVLARTFNIVLFAAGAVFLCMVFYSAYKYAMALGDPKGLQGAKDSLTYAILGFVVVLSFFMIVSFVANYLGLATGVLTSPETVLRQNLQRVQDTASDSGGQLVIPGWGTLDFFD